MLNCHAKNIAYLVLIILLVIVACSERTAPTLSKTNTNESESNTAKLDSSPLLPFKDITDEAGINFITSSGASGNKWFPESMLGGVGFFDYNNDSYPDLIAVRGYDLNEEISPVSNIAIYRNNKDSTFTEVSDTLNIKYYGFGVGLAIGDYDGDSWADIYITSFGENKLYKNINGRNFVDVTDSQKVSGKSTDFSVPAAFIDIDNDGDLDLFVGNYIEWNKEIDDKIQSTFNGANRAYPHPNSFKGLPSTLFRNDGDRGFTDISLESGISVHNETSEIHLSKALGAYPIDVNDDNLIDIIVANDSIKNFFFVNKSNGVFEESADIYGLQYNFLGLPTAAMGIDGSWSGDAESLIIAMGNFSGEMTSIYNYDSMGMFFDISPSIGIGSKTRQAFTFGALFADIDLDGKEDFIQANGAVEPDIKKIQSSLSYAQRPQLFWQCDSNCPRPFIEIAAERLGDLPKPLVGRGLASADIDQDGDLDLVFSSVDGPLKLYRNDQKIGNNWIRVKLLNNNKNIQGIGATIEIQYSDKKQKQLLMPVGSYVSYSEVIATFGLGKHHSVDLLTVKWPDGHIQIVQNISPNQVIEIRRK